MPNKLQSFAVAPKRGILTIDGVERDLFFMGREAFVCSSEPVEEYHNGRKYYRTTMTAYVVSDVEEAPEGPHYWEDGELIQADFDNIPEEVDAFYFPRFIGSCRQAEELVTWDGD